MKKPSSSISYVAFFLALSLLLSWLEGLLPPLLPIPGFRMGLSQIPVLLALYRLGYPEAAMVSLGKVFLASLMLGSFMTFLFWVSFLGSLGSLILLWLSRQGSLWFRSILSALGHNLGQFMAVSLVLGYGAVRPLIPPLLAFSVFLGLLTAFLARLILQRLPK